MFELVESMKEHCKIPSTFDGEIPSFAFEPSPGRLIIGRQYCIQTPQGEVVGELVQAFVLPSEKKAFCLLKSANNIGSAIWVSLSEQEMAAYHDSPQTFFGREQQDPRPITDALKLYDQIHACYRQSSKEQLLKLMENHSNLVAFQKLPQDELACIYAERVTEAIMRDALRPRGS